MKEQAIAVYGAGGCGREVAWFASSCGGPDIRYRVVCFIDDNVTNHRRRLNDIPILGLADAQHQFPHARVVGGIGNPSTRQRLMEKAAGQGFGFETLVHPNVQHSRWIELGIGTVICAGNIITVNIVLGQHVQINMDCTIGHDVIMGDYCTLAPGVHVSGCVHLGQRVYIGTGATILNGTREDPIVIGDDTVIGAGACVTKSVEPGQTVVGVPARPLRKEA